MYFFEAIKYGVFFFAYTLCLIVIFQITRVYDVE